MSWKFLCSAADVAPGFMREFDVAGVKVLVINAEGQHFAVPPNCPHMEEPLKTGICDGGILTCTKHLWQWDLATAEPIGFAETPLLKYELRYESDGAIHVLLDRELIYSYSSTGD